MVKDKKKSPIQTEDDPFGIWMNKIKDLEGIKRRYVDCNFKIAGTEARRLMKVTEYGGKV